MEDDESLERSKMLVWLIGMGMGGDEIVMLLVCVCIYYNELTKFNSIILYF